MLDYYKPEVALTYTLRAMDNERSTPVITSRYLTFNEVTAQGKLILQEHKEIDYIDIRVEVDCCRLIRNNNGICEIYPSLTAPK